MGNELYEIGRVVEEPFTGTSRHHGGHLRAHDDESCRHSQGLDWHRTLALVKEGAHWNLFARNWMQLR